MKDHRNLSLLRWFLIIGLTIWLSSSALSQDNPDDSSISLSLHQADIQDLVRWASSVTQKTIIIHPSIQGSVTVVAGEPMNPDEAYQVFLSVLQVHGFMVIDTDHVLKVVPAASAKENDLPLITAEATNLEDMVVRIIKVKNISATDLMALVRPMLPQSSH